MRSIQQAVRKHAVQYHLPALHASLTQDMSEMTTALQPYGVDVTTGLPVLTEAAKCAVLQ